MDPEQIKQLLDVLIKKMVEEKPDVTRDELSAAVGEAVSKALEVKKGNGDAESLITDEQKKLIAEQVQKRVDGAMADLEQDRKVKDAVSKALAAAWAGVKTKKVEKTAELSDAEKANVRNAPIGNGPAIIKSTTQYTGRRFGPIPQSEFSLVRLCKNLRDKSMDGAREELEKDMIGVEKDMSTENLEEGGIAVPSPTASRIIDMLRAKLVTDKAGMTPQPMTDATLTIPVLAQDAGVFWGAPQNEDLLEGEGLVFSARALVLKDLTALIPVPNRLLEDATFDMEARLRDSIVNKLRLAVDKARLVGTGGQMPAGLSIFPDCTEITYTTLALFKLEAAREIIYQCELVESEATGFIAHPTLMHQLRGEKDAVGKPIYNENPALGQANTLFGYPVYLSNQCKDPTTSTKLWIFGGNFSEVLLGNKGGIKIDASADVGFKSNVTWIRAMMREDLTIEHPEAIIRQYIDAS